VAYIPALKAGGGLNAVGPPPSSNMPL